ncbi:uncharacterized protein [Ptychodera flava]|uniref:uncharacterized protein n=1 Tax=Ptychodera flava TaxID=63121 RepID=UPI00396A75A1
MPPDRKNATNPGKPQRVQPFRNSKGQGRTRQRKAPEDDLERMLSDVRRGLDEPSWNTRRRQDQGHLRRMLFEVGKGLDDRSLGSLKFILGEHLPERKREEITTPESLFDHLIQRRLISSTDMNLLLEPLEQMGRLDLTEIIDRFLKIQTAMRDDNADI